MLLTMGCGRDKAANNAVTPSPEIAFQGTIRAKQWLHSAINTSEVTYTISQDQIRRETKSTFILNKLLEKLSGPVIAGVICKPRKDEVILYCADGKRKHYCRLTLKEYTELATTESLKDSKTCHGFGQLYLDVPAADECQVTNTSNHSTIEGRRCDLHNLQFKSDITAVTITTDHTHAVHVPRELLRLADLNIPDSVTGFPIRIRRVETLTVLNQAQAIQPDARYKRWLAKAAELASKGIKKAFECGSDILSIDPSAPNPSAFELSRDFTELESLGSFNVEFSNLQGDGDWDD